MVFVVFNLLGRYVDYEAYVKASNPLYYLNALEQMTMQEVDELYINYSSANTETSFYNRELSFDELGRRKVLKMLYKSGEKQPENTMPMRAVGMDERQMTKMIACEAFTYAVLGCVVGCAIGLPLSKSLYDFLIAGHFPSAVWQFPIISLGVILLFVSIAAIAAVYAPAKRIRNMSITATINEL